MKKLLLFFPFILLACQTSDNWYEAPVLSDNTIDMANSYVVEQKEYIELIKTKRSIDLKENLTLEDLDEQLLIDKKIAQSSKSLLNSWFDFYIELRQDPGFNRAYKGHVYFRKGIDALEYSLRSKSNPSKVSVKESEYYNSIVLLEAECRLAISEIVAFNNSEHNTKLLFKQLKKRYKTMD